MGCSAGPGPEPAGPAATETAGDGSAPPSTGADPAPASETPAPPTTADPRFTCERIAERAAETAEEVFALAADPGRGESWHTGFYPDALLTLANLGGQQDCPPLTGRAGEALAAIETADAEHRAEKQTGAANQADADAAVERAWEEMTGAPFPGPGAALPDPAPSEEADPVAYPNPDRPGCQTDANPVACYPPEPGPEAEAEVDPETPPVEVDPETPRSIVEFEDKAADVEEAAQTTRRHPDGPVTLGAPVLLASQAGLLCPPEDVWRAEFYRSCGNPFDDDDYLKPTTAMRECWRGPVELGIGDSYRTVLADAFEIDGVDSWSVTTTETVLGFSALDTTTAERWVWVQPRLRSVRIDRFENSDGTVDVEESSADYRPPGRWLQVGGPERRGHNPDGSLAWGLLMLPAPNEGPC